MKNEKVEKQQTKNCCQYENATTTAVAGLSDGVRKKHFITKKREHF